MSDHFTAWLTTDSSALEDDLCDVTVLRDEPSGTRTDDFGNETEDWTSVGDPVFYAKTSIRHDQGADDGSGATAAEQEARDLLENAGWRLTGSWEAVTTGGTVTVSRD